MFLHPYETKYEKLWGVFLLLKGPLKLIFIFFPEIHCIFKLFAIILLKRHLVFCCLVITDCFCNLFYWSQVACFRVSCCTSLGKLVLIELDKQPLLLFPEDSWFPAKVEIKSPEGACYTFPIYRWINDNKVHRFREGTGLSEILLKAQFYCSGHFYKHITTCFSVSPFSSEIV